jgi:L-ascorbate metabolism protein UlaG (beta-lactamase superfamily)
MDHDLKGGKQFGKNIAWKWQQGGINILHLGGAAAPITFEQKIPVGSPDLLLIPVGGGPKAYNAQAAKDAIAILKPKLIIPTQYRTQASDPNNCDISPVDEFLTSMKENNFKVINNKSDFIVLSPNKLPESTEIQVLSYNFNWKNAPKKLS